MKITEETMVLLPIVIFLVLLLLGISGLNATINDMKSRIAELEKKAETK